MKGYKKVVVGMLLGSMMLSTNVFAEEIVVTETSVYEKPLYTATIENDNEIGTYGTSIPSSSKVHNLNTSGKMSFSGEAEISVLYTNSNFEGKSSVQYSIDNKHANSELVAKIYKRGNPVAKATIRINPNTIKSGTISNLEADKSYYIAFSAPSDFSGYVK